MAQTIKLKNSGTSGNTPSSLVHGELALNYADGKLFYKNSSNNIVEFTTSASGSFLPLSGGTLTGNLLLGTNSLAAKNITLNASGSNNPQITFNNNDFSTFDWFFNQDDTGKLIATVTGTGGAEMQLFSDGSNYTNATLHVGGSRVITANAGVAMSTGKLSIPDGSNSDLAIRFVNDTNTGICRTNADELRLVTGGVARGTFSGAGIFSSGNVYSSTNSAFRNYGGVWKGTTGLTGNGFEFSNSVDGTAMTLSSTGNAVFTGEVEASSLDINGVAHISGDTTITGSSGSGNAFVVQRGDNSANVLIAYNNGVVQTPNNYLYASRSSGVSFYSQGTSVFRGNITNDGGNSLVISSGNDDISFNNKNLVSIASITASADDNALTIKSPTNATGVEIKFSDNTSGNQNGFIEYRHSDGHSYGGSDVFTIKSDQTALRVLADGLLMFKSGLAVKPASGTGAGTTIITSGRALQNITSITLTGDIHQGGSLKIGGTTVLNSARALSNVTGNVSMFTNDAGYLTSASLGSNLNADTVDSLHASSFLRSDANDTATGQLTLTRTGINTAPVSDVQLKIKTSTNGSDDLAIEAQSANGNSLFIVRGDGISSFYGNYVHFQGSGAAMYVQNNAVFRGNISNDSGDLHLNDNTDITGVLTTTSNINTTGGGFQINGHTVINSSRHINLFTSGSTGTEQINLGRGGRITFYGDTSASHSISSRDLNGAISDDLRLNTYGGLAINLDANNNNAANADFTIGRHGSGNGTISNLLTVSGETGNVSVTGTVDGRDVAADGAKLDTIATNADVTPSWVPSSNPSYATQSYVGTAISNLVDSAPSTLDTLNELASALNDDANFSTTVTNSIATKLPLAGGTLTGTLTSRNINVQNYTVYGVNNLRFNDPGVSEGIKWDGGNEWQIYESPDNQTNASGNLQFASGSGGGTRRATLDTSGNWNLVNGGLQIGGTAVITSGKVLQNVSGNISMFTNNSSYITNSTASLNANKITSGTLSNSRLSTDMILSGAAPRYRLTETGVTNTPNWWMVADGGNYSIRLNNTGTYPLTIVTNTDNNAVTSLNLGYDTHVQGTIHRGNLTIDSQEIDVGSGDLTLDVAGNITLDAGGGNIDLKEGGTTFGRLQEMIGGLGISAGSTPTFAQLISSTKTLFFGHIELGDSKHVRWGNGNGDLQIFHDGSNSYIEEYGTGDLIISSSVLRPRTNNFILNNFNNTEHMILATGDGAVDLYYDGVKKLNTKSDGVDITGELQSDSLDVDGVADIAGDTVITGSSGSGNAFQVNRGDNSAQVFRIHNSGEVVVSNNYLFAAISGTSFYSQGDAVFRASIRNDTANMPVLVSDGLNVTGYIQSNGTNILNPTGRVLQNVTGNISMFTNDSGYLTSESDTLATVVSRGNITSALTRLQGGGTHLGNHEFASNSTGTSYSTAAIELRESQYTANSSATPPQLGFHWGGVVASNIALDSGGAITIRNNPGTAFEDLRADIIYASGTNAVMHVGNDGSGSGYDSDLLDGQHGSYYLNYNNFSNTPSIPSVGNGTLTVTAGNSLTGGGSFTANQSSSSSVTLGIDTPDDMGSGGFYDVVAWNNQLVKDASVEIHGAGYLRAVYLNMSHGATTRNSDTVFYSSTDDYIRKNTKTSFRTSLDVYSKAETNALIPSSLPANGGNADTLDSLDSSQFVRSDTSDTMSGNYTIDNGTNTLLNIRCDNGGNAIVRAGGQGQGTGVFEVSQDDGQHGGGISYNGDGTPSYVSGEAADHVTFYRISAGTRTKVFHYPYNSNVVNFNSTPTVGGVSLVKTSDTIAQATNAGALDNLDSTQFLRSDADDSVTGNKKTTLHQLRFTGVGTNSNAGNDGYAFYQEAGAWSSPFPDLLMGYHTGVKFGAHKSYGGIRFYNDHPYNSSATILMSVGQGDNNIRIQSGDLYFSSTTSNKAWHAGNDGSGSGLDADTVDGVHASSFLTGNQTITLTGAVTGSGTTSISTLNQYQTSVIFGGSDGSSPDSVMEYQQRSGITDTKLAPDGNWNQALRMGHGDPYNYYSSTLSMQMTGSGAGKLRTQLIHNGTAQGWRTVWDNVTDGSGSGLDADTVDGVHASSLYGVTSVATGGGLTGGTITSTGTISHADTSSVSNVNNSGNTFIQDITFDTYGHVQSVTSATATGSNTTTYVARILNTDLDHIGGSSTPWTIATFTNKFIVIEEALMWFDQQSISGSTPHGKLNGNINVRVESTNYRANYNGYHRDGGFTFKRLEINNGHWYTQEKNGNHQKFFVGVARDAHNPNGGDTDMQQQLAYASSSGTSTQKLQIAMTEYLSIQPTTTFYIYFKIRLREFDPVSEMRNASNIITFSTS